MHNCKLTRNVLFDDALGEAPTPLAREALAQLDSCPSCRAEYAAIRNTLRVSRQALSSAEPAEEFWHGYHTRLSEKLVQQKEARKEQAAVFTPISLPFSSRLMNSVRWFATASVRLPVPAAIAVLLVFGFLSYNTLSRSGRPDNVTTPSAVVPGDMRIVEVPVVQERVVTRTVYAERKARRSPGALRVRGDLTAAERRSDNLDKTAMSLAGFKPTDQVKLTVIKGSYQDDK